MKKKRTKDTSNEYWTYPNLTPPVEIALYYGFFPVEPLDINKQAEKNLSLHSLSLSVDEFESILKKYFEKSQPQLPFMDVRIRPHDKRKEKKKVEYCLDIVGTTRSIADATIIKTTYEIAREEGFEDLVVELNTVGDKDSFARFSRELTSYIKKHISEIDAECRQQIKESPFALLCECNHEKCKEIKEHAPHSMNYLSEPSRTHFKEVLELLEMSDIPYTINPTLIEDPEFALHTTFTISTIEKSSGKPMLISHGSRWGNVAKKLGMKKDIPGVSAVISTTSTKAVQKIKKPQFYFIQMGKEAKLHSLHLIETLRRARIPVYHSLTKDKFSAQLGGAENVKVPHVLIMGQKESIERTVLVREMSNRSQETIRIEEIANYLKKLIR